jgi:Rieske Fe-S protein
MSEPVDETTDEAATNRPAATTDADRLLAIRAPGTRARAREVSARAGPQRVQWREEFPYHLDADDLVTRRDTLRFLVAGTGALFVATGALAVAGNISSGSGIQAVPVARAGELAANESRVFTFPDQYGQGIVVNLPGKGLVAYSDVCTHLSCAVLYEPDTRRFHCPCHEGFFDAATGNVLAGPPTRPLPIIKLREANGIIYAVREVPR